MRGISLCFYLLYFFCNLFGVALAQPMYAFVENKNQWDSRIDFVAKINGGSMQLEKGGFSYRFLDTRPMEQFHRHGHHQHPEVESEPPAELNGHTVKVKFLNSSVSPILKGINKSDTYYNFFIGADSCHWASSVGLFEGVEYGSFYPGINLKLYASGGSLKYDFEVAAGSDPSVIQFRYEGADEVMVNGGDLHVETPFGEVIEKKPYSYQIIDGEQMAVESEFCLSGGVVSFSFPNGYNPCYPLIIDPLLIFSTYSGFTADNWGSTATPGERGALYSAGVTTLANGGQFSATAGTFQTAVGGEYDIGIFKYDSAGQKLLHATLLGGNQVESAHSLIMDAGQNLIVMGTTSSVNFPTTLNAFDRTYNGGVNELLIGLRYLNGSDLFVSKINSNGTALVASTFLGGSSNDGSSSKKSSVVKNYGDELRGDVIVDGAGNILLSTLTSSANFPMRNGFNSAFGGGATDALLVSLTPTLSAIRWSSFLGGSGEDASHTVQFDRAGNIFVAGGSSSANFPTTTGAYQRTNRGDVDGWIARIKADGSAVLSCTFTGTPSFDQVYFVDLDREDNVFVYGQTLGSFPVTAGAYHNPNSGQFLQKFSTDLSALKVSTVFGSSRRTPDISPTAFLVNDCNNIYLTGWGGVANSHPQQGYWGSNTFGMPTTFDAFQKTTSGSDFYFMVLSIDASELLYGTYLGGNQSRTHVDGGTSRFDKGGVVYHAVCAGCGDLNATNLPTSDFPTTSGAWSRLNRSSNCNNAAFKFDLSSLRARIQSNTVDLKQPGITSICLPDKFVFQNKSTGGQVYTWFLGDGTVIQKTDTARITHGYLRPGRYTVKLRAVDAGTCAGRDSTAMVVNVSVSTGAAGPDQTMCFNAGTTLQASRGISYEWTTADKAIKFTTANPFVNPTESTRYFVSIRDGNGCLKKDTVNVKVVPGVDLKFEYSKISSCDSRPVLSVTNLTDEEEDVFFEFGDGSTSTDRQVQHVYNSDGLFKVRLVGKKETCVYEKAVEVPIYTLFVPNVITPGSLGFNDTFKVGYGDKFSILKRPTIGVKIFNRWGEKVYEQADYQDEWAGEGLASGIYYYDVVIGDETACKGWIHLIK